MGEEIEVRYELGPDCNWELTKHFYRTHPARLFVLALATAGTMALVAVLLSRALETPWLVTVASFVLGIVLTPFVVRYRCRRRARITGGLVGPHELSIGPEGIRSTSPGAETTLEWSLVESVEENADWVFVFLVDSRAFPVPKSAFGDPQAAGRFVERAAQLRGRASRPLPRKPFDVWGA